MPVGFRQDYRQRYALSVGEQMVFAAQLASIRWIWACFYATTGSPQRGAIHQGSNPIDFVLLLEFGQDNFKQPSPDSRPVPSTEPTQTGEARRKVGCRRQQTPRNTGSQDKENPIDDFPRFRAFASGILNMTILSGFGKQWFQTTPEIVG